MTRLRFVLTLLLLAPAPVAFAQETPPVVSPAAAVSVSADLRGEYIQGEPILIRFTVNNAGADAARFSDLSRRPWLVRFDLTYPNGKQQSWFTTPPEVDPGDVWSIPPRGQKRVLLEIPSSQRLAAGNYTLTVRLLNEGAEIVLPAHKLKIAPAAPVAGNIYDEPLGLDRSGHQVVWVHKASQGFDLYLHHADPNTPTRALGDYHLLHLDSLVRPVLTAARPEERSDRFIYWQPDERTVQYVQLQSNALRSTTPQSFRTPYPKVEIIGRGSTDTQGGLHVPLWIPAPSGSGGELRVASVRDRGGPVFRSVVRLPAKPSWVQTAVDGNGDLRLILARDGLLDLYTLRAEGDLPASGVALYRPAKPAEGEAPPPTLTPTLARFGYRAGSAEEAGGMAVLVLLRSEVGLEARWVSLGGRELAALEGVPLAADATVIDGLNIGDTGWGALVQTGGKTLYVSPGAEALPLSSAAGTLTRTPKGAVLSRTLRSGGPINNETLRAAQ